MKVHVESKDQILEKRTDSRGRVTLGNEYANKEVQLANVYAAVAETGVFAAVANTLPFVSRILYNFPLLMGAGGFMIILALYACQGGGGRRVAR